MTFLVLNLGDLFLRFSNVVPIHITHRDTVKETQGIAADATSTTAHPDATENRAFVDTLKPQCAMTLGREPIRQHRTRQSTGGFQKIATIQ
jgi:hypothetical protein